MISETTRGSSTRSYETAALPLSYVGADFLVILAYLLNRSWVGSHPGYSGPSSTRVSNAMMARLAAVGADHRDNETMKRGKALLVLISVLILPIAVVWGGLYLIFGSWVGYV